MSKNFLGTTLLCLIITLSACKKESASLGLEVQPEGDALSLHQDTINVSAKHLVTDSVNTTNLSETYVGRYTDPVFGTVSSQLFAQVELPGLNLNIGNPDSISIDSVILTLATTGNSYGNLKSMEFEVYEITESLESDSTYYNTQSVNCSSVNLISSGEELVNVSDQSFGLKGDMPFEFIQLKLDTNLARSWLFPQDDSVLDDNDSFIEYFKGICIGTSTEDGSIIGVNADSDLTAVNIYYTNTEEEEENLVVSFPVGSDAVYFSNVTRDYSSSEFGPEIDSLESNELLYLQGLAGVFARVDLNSVFELDLPTDFMINKAQLVLPVNEGSNIFFKENTRLILTTGEQDAATFLPDLSFGLASISGSPTSSGVFDSSKNQYSFDISLFLNDVLRNNVDPHIFINPVGLQRTVLNGPENVDPDNRMRIILTYSE